MPSAPQREIEPLRMTPDPERPDLHSLLREICTSNVHKLNSLHARGSVLFAEGEPARGVYLLRTGRATVSISSSEGRIVMLRMAHARDVLGLNSVLRNGSYDVTVKTVEPCRTDFISRAELLELMQQSRAVAHAILTILSRELTELTDRAKLLLLPQTASGRLARLLLEWSNGSDPARVNKNFTHEEIAHMICSSRETVTRLLATFTRQQVIHITRDSIVIRDRIALENMGHSA